MCILPRNSLHKAHVGARIFCRIGTLNDYMYADPQWRSIGAMGTEGSEGATPSDDAPESWVDLGGRNTTPGCGAGAPHLVALRAVSRV